MMGRLGGFRAAEAVWSQSLSLPDWITAHVNMLAFFVGVPRQIVSDNLRAGVTRASFYKPLINRTYADMAAHYGTAVVPALRDALVPLAPLRSRF